MWPDPRNPRCPCPASAAGLSGQPGVGFQHREPEITWCWGTPGSQAVSEKHLELGEHFGWSGVRSEALLSSAGVAQGGRPRPCGYSFCDGGNRMTGCPSDRPLSTGCWAPVPLQMSTPRRRRVCNMPSAHKEKTQGAQPPHASLGRKCGLLQNLPTTVPKPTQYLQSASQPQTPDVI